MNEETRSVLIIDDDESIRAGLSAVLGLEGYQVLEAPHGMYGLKLLEMRKIDVLVTDLNMPHKQGCETIVEAKRRWPELVVVAMSGQSSAFSVQGPNGADNTLEKARILGADHVLKKPFRPHELLDAIKIQEAIPAA